MPKITARDRRAHRRFLKQADYKLAELAREKVGIARAAEESRALSRQMWHELHELESRLPMFTALLSPKEVDTEDERAQLKIAASLLPGSLASADDVGALRTAVEFLDVVQLRTRAGSFGFHATINYRDQLFSYAVDQLAIRKLPPKLLARMIAEPLARSLVERIREHAR